MSVRYDRVNGTFAKVSKRFDKVNGIWVPVKTRFNKVGGAWSKSFVGADCQVKNLNPAYGGFKTDGSFTFSGATNYNWVPIAQMTFNDPLNFTNQSKTDAVIAKAQATDQLRISAQLVTSLDVYNSNTIIGTASFYGNGDAFFTIYHADASIKTVYLLVEIDGYSSGNLSWPAAALTICGKNIKTVDLI